MSEYDELVLELFYLVLLRDNIILTSGLGYPTVRFKKILRCTLSETAGTRKDCDAYVRNWATESPLFTTIYNDDKISKGPRIGIFFPTFYM